MDEPRDDDNLDEVETPSGDAGPDDASDSDGVSGLSRARAAANRNETRMRRRRLAAFAPILGIDVDEIRSLASAGMMLPDPYKMLLESDPMRRAEIAENDARYRVQYTRLMVPPKNIDDFIGDDPKTVRIGTKVYVRNEKSLAELMVAVRSTRKVMDAFRRAYEEQHELLSELLRLVQEKMTVAKVMRHSVPSYLLDFARLMESLGCKRNDLRYVDGRVVRAIREALDLVGDDVELGADEAAERFQLWLAEDDAIEGSEPDGGDDTDEFERLSRIAATALMKGDMDAARAAFAGLEEYKAVLERSFGVSADGEADADDQADADDEADSDDQEDADADDGTDSDTADATSSRSDIGPDAGSDSGNISTVDDPVVSTAGPVADSIVNAEGDGRDFAGLTAEDTGSGSRFVSGSQPSALTAEPASQSTLIPAPTPASEPTPQPSPAPTHKILTGWAVTAPVDIEYPRVTGVGRIAGPDPFGGIAFLAASTPEVVPMWEREDLPASMGDRLTLNDWHRFEVPFGNYALVHMPRKLNDFGPVRDELFPPYIDLQQYGTNAGYSLAEMRALKFANSGRGLMDAAARVIRSSVIMHYGEDNEDLVRFWLFLLLGRQFMDRIDILFPHGYFHGVIGPDAAARDGGTGFFRIVRIMDDGDLSRQMRMPRFAPFGVSGKEEANNSAPI